MDFHDFHDATNVRNHENNQKTNLKIYTDSDTILNAIFSVDLAYGPVPPETPHLKIRDFLISNNFSRA